MDNEDKYAWLSRGLGVKALYADPERNPPGDKTVTEPVQIVAVQRFGPVSDWRVRIQKQDGFQVDTRPWTLHPATPETEKWAAVSDEADTILLFLEWLDGQDDDLFTADPLGLVCRYFNIDKSKFDKERRALLAWVRSMTEGDGHGQ